MRLTPNHKLLILCVVIAIPTGIMVATKVSSHDDDDDGDALRQYARQQTELGRKKDAAARAARVAADQRAVALSLLFMPNRPGAPGELFDGLTLGEAWTIDRDPDLKRHVEDFQILNRAEVTILPDLIAVFLPPLPASAGTDDVIAAANKAWQPADQNRWLDEHDHVRATIRATPSGAYVEFQPAITPADLFPADAAVPSALFPALGDAPIPPTLGTAVHIDDAALTYTLPAIGWSRDKVIVAIAIADHEVAMVRVATGAVTDAEIAAIDDALVTRWGQPDPRGIWHAGKLTITRKLLARGLDVVLTRAR